VLSGVVVASPQVIHVAGHILPQSLPLPAIILVLMAVGILVSMAGLNAMLSATVLLALASGIRDSIPDLVLALILLFAWCCSSSMSVASLGVLTVAQLFQVKPHGLIWSRNLAFLSGLGLALAALLCGLARIIQG
jgi:hypothetical protein